MIKRDLPDSGIIMPGSNEVILNDKIDLLGLPGSIEYLRLLLALPAATGFLYIPICILESSLRFKYKPVVSADPPGI